MAIYIALLRGINVSGQKKIKMLHLKSLFEELGYSHVQTYIQSGNVVFETAKTSYEDMENKISTAIKEAYEFDVPILVLSVEKLTAIVEKNPYFGKVPFEGNQMYYVLFKQTPEASLVSAFQKETYENERIIITDHCGYLLCLKGAAKAKLSNNLIERKLKVSATSRNHRTMLKLLEMVKPSE